MKTKCNHFIYIRRPNNEYIQQQAMDHLIDCSYTFVETMKEPVLSPPGMPPRTLGLNVGNKMHLHRYMPQGGIKCLKDDQA